MFSDCCKNYGYALNYRCEKCIRRFILDKTFDPNASFGIDGYPIFTFIKMSNDLLKFLVNNGLKVNVKNGYGSTPLHIAAMMGDLEMTKILVEAGADVNVTDGAERTPLHCASHFTNQELVDYLISHGAVWEFKL